MGAGLTPSVKACGFASSLWEGAIGMVAQFPAQAQSLRANAVSLRGFVLRSAALSQKAALQMPFAATTPTCENGVQKRPQAFLYPEI